MAKIRQLQIIIIWLFLFLHGCIAIEPVHITDSQSRSMGNAPPQIVFTGSPVVIVIPDTDDVYVVPDIYPDLFFWNGWWWRPWKGNWYSSQYYNRGWVYYNHIPSFYFGVVPGWRENYIRHDWYGHWWDYERIPFQRLQQNWKSWKNDRHWERQGNRGVQNYRPRPQQQMQELRQQSQQQYQQRPEVQQPQRQPEERKSQQKPEIKQLQRQPNVRQQQSGSQQPQGIDPEQIQTPQQIHPQGRSEYEESQKPKQSQAVGRSAYEEKQEQERKKHDQKFDRP